jgi:hypothetical protein
MLIQIFFYRVVFLDNYFYWRDLLSHSYPAKKIFVDTVLNGDLPLWNPYISLGIPYLADLSNQPLYFFNLIFLVFPAGNAMNITILLHYLLCGIFTYLFVKQILNNRLIGLFGSIVFVFCGYSISVSCNIEYLAAIVWIPATFWAYYRLLNTCKILYIFLSGFFLSMLIFCGDPMAFYYLSGFLVLRSLFELQKGKSNKYILIFLFLTLTSSLVYAAVQLLPSIELVRLSVRNTGLDFKEATMWSFNPLRLLEFYLPFYFGNNFPYPVYWGTFLHTGEYDIPWVESIYAGIIPLMLALCSFYYSQTKEKVFWMALTLISLVLAFGCFTPVYKLLFSFIPYFDSFRYPEKLIVFTSLGITILACLGLKDLINNKPEFRKYTEMFIIVLVVIAASVLFIDHSASLNLVNMKLSGNVTGDFINSNIIFRVFYFLILFTLLWSGWWFFTKKYTSKHFLIFIITITFIDLFYINSNAYVTSKINYYGQKVEVAKFIETHWQKPYPPRILCSPLLSKFYPSQKEESGNEKFLNNFYDIFNLYWLENLIPNRSIIYNINLIYTVSSLRLKTVKELSTHLYFKNREKFFYNLNINYILASPWDLDIFKQYGKTVYFDKHKTLLKVNNITPRAFMVYDALYYNNKKRLQSDFLRASFDIKNFVLFEGTTESSTGKKDSDSSVVIKSYTPNAIKIYVHTKKPGYLILLDANYPGWKVTIDNKPAELLTANMVYRAVKVSPGKRTVEFIFDPAIIKYGLFITIAGFIISILLVAKFNSFLLSKKIN